MIPPDEYAEGVNDSVYTNMSAAKALGFASAAARTLHRAADPRWARVGGGLRILFDKAKGIHPEYAGYPGDAVKQADVTLLPYPWEHAQPRSVTRADLAYYVPRTDPGGPSMTDAIHSIVTSQLGTPGCAAFTFTRRSADPFMRPPYDQFSEARTGGAFTFTTGAGGFLQEFLYGYTGFRWRADGVALDPSLPPQLTGVRASALHWRGRTLSVAVGPWTTLVTLESGRPVRVSTPAGTRLLRSTLVLPTRRPDGKPTTDLARCHTATAAPATAEPVEAAVDGTVITQWIGDDLLRPADRRPGPCQRPLGHGHRRSQPGHHLPRPSRRRQGRHEADGQRGCLWVRVSADGHYLAHPRHRPPGDQSPRHQPGRATGGPVRFVRLVASGATA